MPILAIETATQVSSVAVLAKGCLAAEVTMQAKLAHSETLMAHIEQAMKMAGSKREEVEAVAVSIGPGSFTGLRIGLAAAKAMAYAWEVPLLGVPTLEVLAQHFWSTDACVLPLIDAQKGSAYTQPFSARAGRVQPEGPIAVQSFGEILDWAGKEQRDVVLAGDVIRKIEGKFELSANVHIAPAHLRMPRAANVAVLGAARLAAGESDNVMDLEPLYIRRSEAEVLWEKRHREGKA